MFAAKNGVFSIVKLLLKFKPDVNIKDSVCQSSVIIECLKQYHVHYITIFSQSNKTALDLAQTSEIRHCLKVAPVRYNQLLLRICDHH